jgi:hypothetical protein
VHCEGVCNGDRLSSGRAREPGGGDFHDVWQTDAEAFQVTPASASKVAD